MADTIKSLTSFQLQQKSFQSILYLNFMFLLPSLDARLFFIYSVSDCVEPKHSWINSTHQYMFHLHCMINYQLGLQSATT